ncbi:MAG: nucleoside phosphorylase [Candidatus Micrarchaeota archaeon]
MKEIPLLLGSPRDAAFFNPVDFVKYARKKRAGYVRMPLRVVLCFNDAIFEHFKKMGAQFEKNEARFANHYLTAFFKWNGKDIAVIKLDIGGPGSVATVEEAIVLGAKKFLVVGFAGGISSLLETGDFVLPLKAIRDEGTSYHYAAPSKYSLPDPGLTRKLIAACEKHGIYPFKGVTWTTDAPYRETVRKLEKYRREGVLTVEMEAASLFAVARHRKARIAGLFIAADLLSGKKWKPHFHKPRAMEAKHKLVEIALDAIV